MNYEYGSSCGMSPVSSKKIGGSVVAGLVCVVIAIVAVMVSKPKAFCEKDATSKTVPDDKKLRKVDMKSPGLWMLYAGIFAVVVTVSMLMM
jgi:hypothetical protein